MSPTNSILLVVLVFSGLCILWMYLSNKRSYQERLQFQQCLHQEQEEASNSIAEDIHDNIMPLVLSSLQRIKGMYDTYPEVNFTNIEQDLDVLHTRLCHLSAKNHTKLIMHYGLIGMLHNWAAVDNSADLKIELDIANALPDPFTGQHALIAYRMIQEVWRNINKHTDATIMYVCIARVDQFCIIQIHDNHHNKVESYAQLGIGKYTLARRARLLRASYTYDYNNDVLFYAKIPIMQEPIAYVGIHEILDTQMMEQHANNRYV